MFFKGTSPKLITLQNLDKFILAYGTPTQTCLAITLAMTESKLSIQKTSGFLTHFPLSFS